MSAALFRFFPSFCFSIPKSQRIEGVSSSDVYLRCLCVKKKKHKKQGIGKM